MLVVLRVMSSVSICFDAPLQGFSMVFWVCWLMFERAAQQNTRVPDDLLRYDVIICD